MSDLFNFGENKSSFKKCADLEAGCVDHGDVGTQGVAEEVSSAEKTPISLIYFVSFFYNLNDVILVLDLRP